MTDYMMPPNEVDTRVATWLATLTAHAEAKGHTVTTTYSLDPLRKFVRIVESYGSSRSVHAFYDPATGDVFKAASWKAPAKIVRFNLLDDESFARMIEACADGGYYLYVR